MPVLSFLHINFKAQDFKCPVIVGNDLLQNSWGKNFMLDLDVPIKENGKSIEQERRKLKQTL